MDTTADPLDRFGAGVRVSLRHRLADGRATDVIGLIQWLDPTSVQVLDRRGELHTIDRATVIAARAVPVSRGPDPLRTDADALERIAADSWHDAVEPLGGWWLRSAGGATNRANSALAVGDPGRPVADAAAAIIAYARAHRIPAQAQVVVDGPADRRLQDLGWRQTRTDTSVLVARLVDLCGSEPGTAVISDDLDPDWFGRYREDHPSAATDDQVRRLLLSGRTTFASLRRDTALVAIGRASLAEDWVTLFGLWTDPSSRRQGLMRDVLRSLCWWGAARGARSAQLQVDTANPGALAAYDRLGFVHHHDYRYLAPAAHPLIDARTSTTFRPDRCAHIDHTPSTCACR